MDAISMDDVSELDASGRISLRDRLTGARPVVGCLGAGGLKILACSWFALGMGGLGLLPGNAGAHRTVQISSESPRADAVSRTTTLLRGASSTTPLARARRAAVQPAGSGARPIADANAGGVDEAPGPAAPGAAPAESTDGGGAKPPAAPAPEATAGPTPGDGVQEPPPPPSVLDVVAPVLETVVPPPLPVPLPVSPPVPDVTAVTGELGLP